MAGRKSKPTNLKVLTGNPGKRALNKNEPKPKMATIKPPPGLSKLAKKHWRQVAAHLVACGLLTEADKPAFSLYCEAYAKWADANEMIATHGTVVKSPNGFPVQSPYLAIANRAHDQMVKLLVEFGMTPSSRSGISVEPQPKPASGANAGGFGDLNDKYG